MIGCNHPDSQSQDCNQATDGHAVQPAECRRSHGRRCDDCQADICTTQGTGQERKSAEQKEHGDAFRKGAACHIQRGQCHRHGHRRHQRPPAGQEAARPGEESHQCQTGQDGVTPHESGEPEKSLEVPKQDRQQRAALRKDVARGKLNVGIAGTRQSGNSRCDSGGARLERERVVIGEPSSSRGVEAWVSLDDKPLPRGDAAEDDEPERARPHDSDPGGVAGRWHRGWQHSGEQSPSCEYCGRDREHNRDPARDSDQGADQCSDAIDGDNRGHQINRRHKQPAK